MPTPSEIARPDIKYVSLNDTSITTLEGLEHIVRIATSAYRVHVLGGNVSNEMSAVLPMDDLLDVRLSALRRLWQALTGRKLSPNSARLTRQQRDRYVLALRAFDGRSAKATYREIATALFGAKRVEGRGWKTHDLRDRTIGLWKLARDMTEGGYRQLLVYPYRKHL